MFLSSEYICTDEAKSGVLIWKTPIIMEAVVTDRELLELPNIFSRVEDDGIDSIQLLEHHENQRDDESLHGAAWGHQVSQRPIVVLRFLNRVLHLSQFVLHLVFWTSEPLQGLLSDILPKKYMSVFRTWLTVTQMIGRASVYSAQSRLMPLALRLYELSPSEPHSLNFGRLFPSMSWVLWNKTMNRKNENNGFERKRSSEK